MPFARIAVLLLLLLPLFLPPPPLPSFHPFLFYIPLRRKLFYTRSNNCIFAKGEDVWCGEERKRKSFFKSEIERNWAKNGTILEGYCICIRNLLLLFRMTDSIIIILSLLFFQIIWKTRCVNYEEINSVEDFLLKFLKEFLDILLRITNDLFLLERKSYVRDTV